LFWQGDYKKKGYNRENGVLGSGSGEEGFSLYWKLIAVDD
jgi:hypothetical protein